MEIFNKNTTNFFYDLLTEEMGIIRNVQNYQGLIRNTPLLPNKKVKERYQNSDKNINKQTGLFKYIGIVVYLTYSFEQDAYLNAAYNYIMQECGSGEPFLYIYSQTEAYNSLHKMRNILDIIKETLKDKQIKEMLSEHCVNEYNCSLEKIYNNGEKAYKRYAKKLARMYSQAIKDVEKKQIKEGWLFHTREFYNPFKMELTEMKNLDNTIKRLGF